MGVVGCGTSFFVATAYAAAREAGGLGETDAFAASEFPTGRAYDALLAVSRSGTTTEVLDAVAVIGETISDRGPHRGRREPAGARRRADRCRSRSPTSARSSRPGSRRRRSCCCWHTWESTRRPRPRQPRTCSGGRSRSTPASFDRFHFLGRGWTVGLAYEAALKLREAALAWSEAYPAMEYRHGPIALADGRTLVVPMGELDPALAADIRATGATLLDAEAEPLASLVLAHRLAISLAHLRGLDPDNPRNLTRSVVLP